MLYSDRAKNLYSLELVVSSTDKSEETVLCVTADKKMYNDDLTRHLCLTRATGK